MRGLRLFCYSFAVLSLLFCGRPVLAEETIKLAYTDPFSGPFDQVLLNRVDEFFGMLHRLASARRRILDRLVGDARYIVVG